MKDHLAPPPPKYYYESKNKKEDILLRLRKYADELNNKLSNEELIIKSSLRRFVICLSHPDRGYWLEQYKIPLGSIWLYKKEDVEFIISRINEEELTILKE